MNRPSLSLVAALLAILAVSGCECPRPVQPAIIAGTVTLATADRSPIAGADIYVTPVSHGSSATTESETPFAQTRDNGSFTATGVPTGDVNLRVVPPEGSGAQASIIPMTTVAGAETAIQVRLVPDGTQVTAIELSPNEVRMSVGSTYTFQYRVDTSTGVSLVPTFSVVGTIGRISGSGVFTSTAAGEGEVHATLGTVSDMTAVTCVDCNVVEETDQSPPELSHHFVRDERGMTKALVGWRTGVVTAQAARALTAVRGQITDQFKVVNAVGVELPYDELDALAGDPRVAYIEPNAVVSVRQSPDLNAAQVLPWGVNQVNAERVWGDGEGALHVLLGSITGRDVKVAVVDTGIDTDHPDLQVAGGMNVINPYASYDDDMGHGSLAAGIIAAQDNGVGVIGIAPDCRLYAVKALDAQGMGDVADVVHALEWCINPTDNDGDPLPEGPMDIINLSLGVTFFSQTLKTACDAAWVNPNHPHGGAILIAASGNNEPNVWPGNFGSVISVGSTSPQDQLSDFSSTGPAVELTAPGEDILSTLYAGRYDTRSGTSFSAPHVAGVAALVYATGRYSSAANLRQHLRDTAVDLGSRGRDELYGYGRVDALAAVVDEGCSDIFPRALFRM